MTQEKDHQKTPITSAFPPLLLRLSSSMDNSFHGDRDYNDDDQLPSSSSTPLCDLQTFLRLADCADTGGQAKVLIQAGECNLNGVMETRRAKKLFEGDVVAFQGVEYNVVDVVKERGYVQKVKTKKIHKKLESPLNSGNRRSVVSTYRSKEWRDERKQRKGTLDGYVGNDDWKEIQKVKKMKERQMKRNDQTIQLKKFFASMANPMDDDDSGKADRKKQRLVKKSRFAKLEAMKKDQSQE